MTITQDPSAPLVVVVGATGIQGGSVIRELKASDRPYRIRGLTRDANKPVAQELAKQGVEMRSVNLVENAPAVKDVFKGADIAFIVTNFWEHTLKQKEIDEGKLLIDAAHEGGAKRILWSGLESFIDATSGKYTHVDHFEGKAEITKYARSKLAGTGVAFVLVDAGMYMSNMTGLPGMTPRPAGDGTYVVATGSKASTKLPWIDMVSDYGLWVRLGIEDAEYEKGGDIFTAGEEIAWEDVVKQLSDAIGKTVTYKQLAPDEYRSQSLAGGVPERIVQEFIDNFAAFDEVGYYAGRPLTSHAKLARKPRTLKQFAAAQDWGKILA